ncbi:DUF2812 domain-containing protein [Anaeromicropila herbilytica]|uniref:DUF2812 domain-containing protein n=1 Tax=Anaeromicropila herbilytica TaxID=2785025 RepID=A0A7R7IDC2_9FIRM|nr:DUF2812 domain-containing protein [Anaeromicropila herbilytica]BCN30786.1 hypothetical protein bsdtb5_20810 [Anaeromicropila herbilytica]
METKIERKKFGIADFKEEEKWLLEQHKSGWKLVKTNGIKYYFEKCNAEEWIYQLDFNENTEKDESYIQMFLDYGWEYVFHYGKWFYFRKKREGWDTANTIFSDNASKIEMYKRIIYHLFELSIPLFLFSCMILYLFAFTTIFHGDDFLDKAIPWAGITMMVATSFSFGQFLKLFKMVFDLRNPIQ